MTQTPIKRAQAVLVYAGLMALVFAPPSIAQTAAKAPDMSQRPVTRVLAIGTLTSKATAAALPAILAREVPATLKLYLDGKISDWYAKPDQTGVVFLLNVTTVDAAKAVLDPLPLGQAGMMTFELTPLGPLQPLGALLTPSQKQ